MAVTSAEQRIKELQDRDAMLEEADKLTEDQKNDLIKNLSIRDRLMRRFEVHKIKAVIKDEFGEFTIETRQLTSEEMDNAQELNAKIADAKSDRAKYREALNAVRDWLPEFTITPGIKWKDPKVTDDVVMVVFLSIIFGTTNRIKEGISTFRQE